MNRQPYSPLVVATAMSLYAYNISPLARAQRLHEHFNGDCMELDEMATIFVERGAYAATELPAPTALVYVQQALKHYGAEAEMRVLANLKRIE